MNVEHSPKILAREEKASKATTKRPTTLLDDRAKAWCRVHPYTQSLPHDCTS